MGGARIRALICHDGPFVNPVLEQGQGYWLLRGRIAATRGDLALFRQFIPSLILTVWGPAWQEAA